MNFEFESIELENEKDSKLSHLYEVNLGGFGELQLNRGIRTLSSNVLVKVAREEFRTYESLALKNDWPVSVMFQREIDEKRIEKISEKYILSKDTLKYYPPITIVLLPEKDGIILEAYETFNENKDNVLKSVLQKFKSQFKINLSKENEEKFDIAFKSSEILSSANGIYIIRINIGLKKDILCWDKTKYKAIVIDGQHRLESLKTSARKDPDVESFNLDVVFLDIADSFFKNNKIKNNPSEIARKVFVDVNKNSTPMNKATYVIMDDRDLSALAVQSVLDDSNSNKVSKYIKPQLVDWHSLNLKHELPHLTSVIVLYQIFSDYFLSGSNLASLDDFRDSKKVEKFVRTLNSRFLIDEYISKYNEFSNLKKLSNSYSEFEKQTSSGDESLESQDKLNYVFDFDFGIYQVFSKCFSDIYQPCIVEIFEQLKPYKIIDDYNINNKIYANDSILKRALIKSPEKRSISKNEELAFEEHANKISSLREVKTFDLIYTVVGQKTIFSIFCDEIYKGMASNISLESAMKVTSETIKKLNNAFSLLEAEEQMNLFASINSENNTALRSEVKSKKNRINFYDYFLEGILYTDGKIVYNERGVQSFKKLIAYVVDFVTKNESVKFEKDLVFPEFKIPWLEERINSSYLKYFNKEISKSDKEEYIEYKREAINNHLRECFSKKYLKKN